MLATRGLATIAITAVIACGRSAPEPSPTTSPPTSPPSQAAYVWQRNWTPGVRDAVAHPPTGIDELRVLIAEVSPSASLTMMPVDAESLANAGVSIALVIRIEGSRPIEALSLEPIVAAANRLRAADVNVIGIEVDHDCATARLAGYARWLASQRHTIEAASRPEHTRRAHTATDRPDHFPAGNQVDRSAAGAGSPDDTVHDATGAYRFSITALPTWASSPALIDVARAVDEIVVQVHAVRAPLIFDANTAWRDLHRFARAIANEMRDDAREKAALRVALPTYSAIVRDVEVSVDPEDVARFVRRLRTEPIAGVDGIVWFRLPVEGDEQTWSRATFARLVDGARASHPIARTPHANIELVSQGDHRFDVVVSNPTGTLVDLPPIRIAGDIGAADMVAGYREAGPGRWDAPRRSLARGERIVIGWIYGKDISLVE